MAKMAQSIETLSLPKWRNLYFSFAIIVRWNCNGLCIRFVTAREGEFAEWGCFAVFSCRALLIVGLLLLYLRLPSVAEMRMPILWLSRRLTAANMSPTTVSGMSVVASWVCANRMHM